MRQSFFKATQLWTVVIFSCFHPLILFASTNHCLEYGDKIDQISTSTASAIICGQKSADTTTISSVLLIKKNKATSTPQILFVADEAFKTYRFSKNAKTLLITESLNQKESLPLVEIQITCKNNSCQKTETCIWKKNQQNPATLMHLNKELQKLKPQISDTEIDQVFIAALNGHPLAQNFFSKEVDFSDASFAEAYSTYQKDILRLKKISCWK